MPRNISLTCLAAFYTILAKPAGLHFLSLSINPPEGISHVQAGTLKIIALFAEKRREMSPDVFMVKEQGIDLAIEDDD